MNKFILMILMLCFSSYSSAQSNSDYSGMWKCIVKVSGLKANNAPPTFMIFEDNGSYIWGVDSVSSKPLIDASTGIWSVTEEGEIKMTPSDTAAEIRYYKPSGNKSYKYAYIEKDGKKIHVNMLEMDFYIMKIEAETDK